MHSGAHHAGVARVTRAARAFLAGLTLLSGYRGSRIFYEKYLFGDGVISAFAMEFPAAEKPVYSPIVERIENSFRAGHSDCLRPLVATALMSSDPYAGCDSVKTPAIGCRGMTIFTRCVTLRRRRTAPIFSRCSSSSRWTMRCPEACSSLVSK